LAQLEVVPPDAANRTAVSCNRVFWQYCCGGPFGPSETFASAPLGNQPNELA
jgi:hypothetical protein